MSWILVAFLVASLLHMTEEYFFPGGFMQMMRRLNPRFASFVTTPMAIVFNGLQIVLCVVALAVGKGQPLVGLSVAGLILVNGLVHIGVCVRVNGYAPGVITGMLLYLPLSACAYIGALTKEGVSVVGALITIVLGSVFQLLPVAYLSAASGIARRQDEN